MTATTLSHPTRTASTGLAVRRAMAAEWTRLWTVRSTWWSLAATTAMMLLVGATFGLDVEGTAPVWLAGELGMVFAQFALLLPVMLAVTSEYATGAIHSTLQAVPRRGVLALARTLVPVTVVTVVGVVLAAAADLAAGVVLGPQAEVVAGDVAGSLADVATLVASGAVLTAAIGAALRSSAGTLTSMFMLWLVLPTLLPQFGVPWLTTIGEHLPGSGAMAFLGAFGEPALTPTHATVVLMGWLAVAGAAGLASLLRRDAA